MNGGYAMKILKEGALLSSAVVVVSTVACLLSKGYNHEYFFQVQGAAFTLFAILLGTHTLIHEKNILGYFYYFIAGVSGIIYVIY